MDLSSMPVEDGYDGPMMEGAGPPVHPSSFGKTVVAATSGRLLSHARCTLNAGAIAASCQAA